MQPADCGLVLSSSTGFVFGNLLARFEDWMRFSVVTERREPAIEIFDFIPDPTDTAHLDFAITIDEVGGRYIRELVCIRSEILLGIVESHWKGDAILFHESFRVRRVVLRNAKECNWFIFVKLEKSVKIRKCILTCRAAHFEERE